MKKKYSSLTVLKGKHRVLWSLKQTVHSGWRGGYSCLLGENFFYAKTGAFFAFLGCF